MDFNIHLPISSCFICQMQSPHIFPESWGIINLCPHISPTIEVHMCHMSYMFCHMCYMFIICFPENCNFLENFWIFKLYLFHMFLSYVISFLHVFHMLLICLSYVACLVVTVHVHYANIILSIILLNNSWCAWTQEIRVRRHLTCYTTLCLQNLTSQSPSSCKTPLMTSCQIQVCRDKTWV